MIVAALHLPGHILRSRSGVVCSRPGVEHRETAMTATNSATLHRYEKETHAPY